MTDYEGEAAAMLGCMAGHYTKRFGSGSDPAEGMVKALVGLLASIVNTQPPEMRLPAFLTMLAYLADGCDMRMSADVDELLVRDRPSKN